MPKDADSLRVPTRVVILAAGHSSRMGHPKALTRLDGRTALARLVHACAQADLERPVVVVGRDAARIRQAHPALDVLWVENATPDAGRTGSLKLGLARLDDEAVLVAPIDHPLVRPATLLALANADALLAVPEHAGRAGHPVRIAGTALREARELRDEAPLRDLFRRDPSRVVRIPVDDPGVLANLDTPDDVATWRRHA